MANTAKQERGFGELSDRTIICRDCGQEFTFTAGEQAFYAERGYSEPQRCSSCRASRKAQRASSGYDSGSSYSSGGGGYSSGGGGDSWSSGNNAGNNNNTRSAGADPWAQAQSDEPPF